MLHMHIIGNKGKSTEFGAGIGGIYVRFEEIITGIHYKRKD